MSKPYLLCAIGDIHGEFDLLKELHSLVLKRQKLLYPDHDLTLVHVGDFIDRGPKSFEVIEELIRLEQVSSFDVVNIIGNHERQFVDAYDSESPYANKKESWLKWGGVETIASYELAGKKLPYKPHVEWIETLPAIWTHEPSKTIFVHAGIDPETYPDNDLDILLWTRSNEFMDADGWDNPALDGWSVVHGHTPTKSNSYEISGTKSKRINIDTGAVYSGALTAVFIRENAEPEFISVKSNSPPWKSPV
ncbi:MAG: metallophosphoesterase family protein [Henriciella sp.]